MLNFVGEVAFLNIYLIHPVNLGIFQAVVIKHFRQIFVMAVSHIAIGKKTYFYFIALLVFSKAVLRVFLVEGSRFRKINGPKKEDNKELSCLRRAL
jgi:hypothetical protein